MKIINSVMNTLRVVFMTKGMLEFEKLLSTTSVPCNKVKITQRGTMSINNKDVITSEEFLKIKSEAKEFVKYYSYNKQGD